MSMINYFQQSADEFISNVEKFSKSNLNRKVELLEIFKEAQKSGSKHLFEDLVFNAKYVMGLMRAVQKGASIPEINNLEKIKKDFADNINKTISQVKEIISPCSEDLKNHFSETYFILSGESFINLTELLSDLEKTKIYLNHLKRSN